MKKIRVLHVVKVLDHGGAETMIMNIYRNINKEKIQFDFLCLSELNGEYEEEIKKLGGKIYKVPDPKEQGRIKNFYSIYKIMKEKNIKVVHSHIMFYNGFINFIAWLVGIKVRISHSHSTSDVKKEDFARKTYMRFSRFLINLFSNVKIACGEKAGEYLYGKNKKIIILKNGIDLDKYLNVTKKETEKLKAELGIEEDFVIGHVGRFEKVKNHNFFIELAREIKKEKLNYKIVLVGNGSEYENIKNRIINENLSQYFILTGIRDDIHIFMNMFDIFIMPSLYEGFPLVVVEALAGNCICYLSNNISKETKIIEERVNFFDLNIEMKDLIENIKNTKKEKIDIKNKLIDSGFSIKDMTNKLSEIYLG